MSKNPTRITVAFDQSTAKLLEKISQETDLSQSEIMRRALKFYSENKPLTDPTTRKKAYAYMDLLLDGEHVILDFDHRLLFLRLIESSRQRKILGRTPRGCALTQRTTKKQNTFSRRAFDTSRILQLLQDDQKLGQGFHLDFRI